MNLQKIKSIALKVGIASSVISILAIVVAMVCAIGGFLYFLCRKD